MLVEHEFKCQICNTRENHLWEPGLEFPDHCGSKMMKIYRTNFILKGEGWSKQNWEKPNEEIDKISIRKER